MDEILIRKSAVILTYFYESRIFYRGIHTSILESDQIVRGMGGNPQIMGVTVTKLEWVWQTPQQESIVELMLSQIRSAAGRFIFEMTYAEVISGDFSVGHYAKRIFQQRVYNYVLFKKGVACPVPGEVTH